MEFWKSSLEEVVTNSKNVVLSGKFLDKKAVKSGEQIPLGPWVFQGTDIGAEFFFREFVKVLTQRDDQHKISILFY